MDDSLPRIVSVEFLPFSSIYSFDRALILSIHLSASWMDPLVTYLRNGILPEDKKEAERVRRRSLWYWVSKEGKLYERLYSGPYPLCMHPEAVEVLLKELHKGIYGNYTGGRLLAHKALT